MLLVLLVLLGLLLALPPLLKSPVPLPCTDCMHSAAAPAQARMREQGVAAEHGHKRERQEPEVPADVPRALHRFFKK